MTTIQIAQEQKRTVIIVSHDESITKYADKIGIVRDGMMVAFGSKDEVFKKVQMLQNQSR